MVAFKEERTCGDDKPQLEGFEFRLGVRFHTSRSFSPLVIPTKRSAFPACHSDQVLRLPRLSSRPSAPPSPLVIPTKRSAFPACHPDQALRLPRLSSRPSEARGGILHPGRLSGIDLSTPLRSARDDRGWLRAARDDRGWLRAARDDRGQGNYCSHYSAWHRPLKGSDSPW